MPPTRHSSVISTAISFAVGLLFGYIIRDFLGKLNRHKDNNQIDDLAQQHHPGRMYCHMEGTKSAELPDQSQVHQEQGQEEPDEVAAELVDGLARPLIHKSPSGEDIFFDARCDG